MKYNVNKQTQTIYTVIAFVTGQVQIHYAAVMHIWCVTTLALSVVSYNVVLNIS